MTSREPLCKHCGKPREEHKDMGTFGLWCPTKLPTNRFDPEEASVTRKVKPCKLCHERPAVVPDRETAAPGRFVAEVCRECHGARLMGDLRRVLAAHRRKDLEAS